MLSQRIRCALSSPRSNGIKRHPVQIRFMRVEPGSPIKIEYLGRLAITVSGRFTGNAYRFSPLQPFQKVNPRDAFYLLASTRFGVAP